MAAKRTIPKKTAKAKKKQVKKPIKKAVTTKSTIKKVVKKTNKSKTRSKATKKVAAQPPKAFKVEMKTPLTKKNGWFYVSISMAAFFLTFVFGTLLNPQFSQYLQASILANPSGEEQETTPERDKSVTPAVQKVEITLIQQDESKTDTHAGEKLRSIFTSVFPEAVITEVDQAQATSLIAKHNIVTLPALLANKAIESDPLFKTVSNFFTASRGMQKLEAGQMNPNDQIYINTPQFQGLTIGNSESPITIYDFTDFSIESVKYFNNNWNEIEKRLLPLVKYSIVFLPNLDVPIEWDAAFAATCVYQQKQSVFPSFYKSLYSIPQLSSELISAKVKEVKVDLSKCDKASITNDYRFTWPIAQDNEITQPHALILAGPKYARLLQSEITSTELSKLVEQQQ